MDVGQLILRSVQFIFVIILTALLGNVIANNVNGKMSAINYSLFATIMAWLAVIWGFASSFVGSLSGGIFSYASLALDGLALLFTFIAAIVLPAKLHAPNCGGNLTVLNKGITWIGFGSANVEQRCRELQASTAFMWFLFATLAASFALTAISSSRRRGPSGGGGAPHMTQVRV